LRKSIGLQVKKPEKECIDKHCPFHGNLSVRGKLFVGKVSSNKARQTITIQKEAPVYFTKFRRYARGKSMIHAHLPLCITVNAGDLVAAAECRPISKSVAHVIVEVKN